MEMTVKEYAERENIKNSAAHARLKRRCERVRRGIYEVPDSLHFSRKNAGNKLSDDKIRRIRELRGQGNKLWQIAVMTGASVSTISKYCGVEKRADKQKRARQAANYLREGYTAKQIAQMIGVSKETVVKRLKETGFVWNKSCRKWVRR